MTENVGRPINGLTVDVEDWIQSVYDVTAPLTDRFCRSTHRVLDLLAEHGVRGTFFVLGLAAEKAPALVGAIQRAGHEIQSHGYGHRAIHHLTAAQFREDITRGRQLLEDITGTAVIGYRAPRFSIDLRTLWALDLLADCGYEYDSSVVSVRTRRYGIAGAPRVPYRLRTPGGRELLELPVASYRLWGKIIPMGGGGYYRLFPYSVARQAICQINLSGWPATIYLHPYEFDPDELRELPVRIPRRLRIHQGIGRRGVPGKIGRLLSELPFGPLCEVIPSLSPGTYRIDGNPSIPRTITWRDVLA
jgi:polysaccharide deacetylase family protein (PEP-CTERM system associated)